MSIKLFGANEELWFMAVITILTTGAYLQKKWRKKSIAIIGAGPAGIYTALLLETFTGQVTLFEQNQGHWRKSSKPQVVDV